MYPKAVSRAVRRINYRKMQRDPPVAVIGNVCSPVITTSLTEKEFRENILPLAEANNWIEYPVYTLINNQEDITLTSNIIDTPDFTTELKITRGNMATSTILPMSILFSNGDSVNVSLSDFPHGEIDQLYISTGFIVICDTSSSGTPTSYYFRRNISNRQYIKSVALASLDSGTCTIKYTTPVEVSGRSARSGIKYNLSRKL